MPAKTGAKIHGLRSSRRIYPRDLNSTGLMKQRAHHRRIQNRTSSRAIIELVENTHRHRATQKNMRTRTPYAARLPCIAAQKLARVDTRTPAATSRDGTHEVTLALKHCDDIFMR
jgi:hypothetical protein